MKVVAEYYPDGSLDTVSSALFLRFINPAIVSPQSYNLVQGDIPNGARRGLTFISKVTPTCLVVMPKLYESV